MESQIGASCSPDNGTLGRDDHGPPRQLSVLSNDDEQRRIGELSVLNASCPYSLRFL